MATAVPAERDAVAGVSPAPGRETRLPGATLLRAGGLDLLAAGVGPALAASSVSAALTAAALAGTPYGLVARLRPPLPPLMDEQPPPD
ncbi:futalosine hydrolase, partial [Streptomyces sp. NPDC005534]